MRDERNDDPLSVAVVGTNVGCMMHVRGLRGAGFEVRALVGRDRDRTAERAAFFGIPVAAHHVEAVLDSDVDAVVIATPPATHHDLVMQALAAGKHVLCEKPFSLDLGQAQQMLAAADESGLVAHVVHEFRWAPRYNVFRELVRSSVGTPLQATFGWDFPLLHADSGDLPDWWRDSATGGGWIRNWGTHAINLVRYLVGEFAAVSGCLHDDPARELRTDDSYAFVFELANGLHGVMTGSSRGWEYRGEARLIGTRASVSFDGGGVWIADAAGKRRVSTTPEILEFVRAGGGDPGAPADGQPQATGAYSAAHATDLGYAEQVAMSRAFANQIRDRSYQHPAIATFRDGYAHMRVLLAVEQSFRTRRWAELR